MKIVYIYSLGYSGSTTLSLVLGLHPKMIAVGEVFPWLELSDFSGDCFCSCGKSFDSCPLWSGFDSQINSKMSLKEKYSSFLRHFSERNNKEKILVDSSKVPREGDYLDIIKKTPGIDLKVIFLLRDVRGFSLSNKKHKNKGSILLYQLNWWRRNRQFKKYLQNNDFDYLQVSYEELCFKKKETLKALTNFIGVDFSEEMMGDLNLSDSHIIRGNIMRSDKKRKKGINYDYRWFFDRSTNVNYTLLPLIARWNERNVYKNIKQE